MKFELKISRPVTPATAVQISDALQRQACILEETGQEMMALDIRVIAIMIERQVQDYLKESK